MTNLEKRAEQLAQLERHIIIGRIAAKLAGELRGATMAVDQSGIRISGVGLFKRWLNETGLRFAADLIK